MKESVTRFLKEKLRLKVNAEKSKADSVNKRSFLGYTVTPWNTTWISHKSVDRLKQTIRKITKRNRGVSLETVVKELNGKLPGWVRYYKLANARSLLREIDAWIRHKLRCYKLKQRKRARTIGTLREKQGIHKERAWSLARVRSFNGWWATSISPQAHVVMKNKWFNEIGLKSLEELYVSI